jgi:hypothetical protein
MKRKTEHYVNNKEFSSAVNDYVILLNEATSKGTSEPIVTDYIAKCFLKIAEGLSHRPNFIRYTYRDEMVMDAVENCLRAIKNYNIDAATRTGNANAFSYFTQISFYAFLRRIEKEKRQFDTRMRYINKMGIEDLMEMGMDNHSAHEAQAFVDTLREKIDAIKSKDEKLKTFAKEEKVKAKSKLELFME